MGTTTPASLGDICRAVYDLLPNLTSMLVDEYDCGEYLRLEPSVYGFFIEVEVLPSTFKEWVKTHFKEDFEDYTDDIPSMLSEWAQCNPPRSAKLFDLYSEEILSLVESSDCENIQSVFEGCLTGLKTNLLDIALGSIAATIIEEEGFDNWCDDENSDEDEEDIDEGDYEEVEGSPGHDIALYYESVYPDTDLFNNDLIDLF